MVSVLGMVLVATGWAKSVEIRLSAAPTTCHPLYAWTREDHFLRELIHEGLFEPDGRGSYRSDIVESWTVDNALVNVTLLKRRWHDGRPLVAADVCATIERVRATDRPTPYTAAANAQIATCAAGDPDGTTVRITLTAPLTEPRSALLFPLVPAHRADWAGAGPTSTIVPIGLGAYAAEIDDRGWKLTGDGSTPTKKVHLSVVPDPALAIAEGRGAGAPFLDPPALATVRAVPEISLEVVPGDHVWALFVNPTRGPLGDPAVRSALDMLLDRDALASAVYGRDPQLATQPWTFVSGPFLPRSPKVASTVPVPVRDVDVARSLLTGAGLVRTDQGWTWQGAPWVLRVATPVGLGPDAEALEKALTEQLDGVGIDVLPLSSVSWWFGLLAGSHQQSTDLALVPIDPYDPGPNFHTRTATEGYANPFGWGDPETDALTALTDDEQGRALHARLGDLHPALFLWVVDGRSAWRSGFDPKTAFTRR